MDPLEDLFADGAAKTSRAVGKFQPKAKARPVKKGPVAATPAPSSQSNQLGGADKREGTEALKAGQLSTIDGSSEHNIPAENACAPVGSHMEGDTYTPVGESVEIFHGLESLDDFLPHDTNATETTIPSSEELAINVLKGVGEDQLAIPTTLPVGDSAPVSNIPGAQNSEVSAAQGPLTCGEPIVATHEGVSQIDSIDLGIEGIETYPCLETPDGPELATGWHTGKFQPKPKVHVSKESCDTGVPNSCAQDSQSTDFVDKERLPALSDDVLDLSSLGFDHGLPTESTSEVPVYEEMPNVNVNFLAEHPGSSGLNEDENIDLEFQVENESQKKRTRKKSKKKAGDEEKPARKRKKANDKTDQATKEKPKKFPHTTRQKRRMVDKALLDTPEEEIDFQRVPIKDLIMLAEHKERLAKKEAALQTLQPQANPSNFGNSSELNNEDERFPFDEYEDGDRDGDAFNEQTTNQVEDSTIYFNYQTYMEKTPRVRWSKEDTELFYEGIRQFGSDFSMIQQLFPGRTRTQIRLKYKKEEQRQPSRIHDALTNRAKDYSRFEQVIAHLKQIAAEENQNDDEIDVSIDFTAEEVEGHKEESKSEHNEEDITQANSSVFEDEEDEDIW